MDILHPTPEEMTSALLDAAEAERWNHWRHEVRQHTDDWRDAKCMRRPLTAEEFAQLPETAARYPFVELRLWVLWSADVGILRAQVAVPGVGFDQPASSV